MKTTNFTADDLCAVVFAIFYNLNLRVYDNGLSMAENVLNNILEG